jgi:ABC-type transporter Mla subunit MlaD
MGSEHLGEELGRLSGQLNSLAPALEHMEERERETVAKIATLETKVDAQKRDLDELVRKVSARLKEVYQRLGTVETMLTGLGPMIAEIKTKDIVMKVDVALAAIDKIEKAQANVWKKIWDVSKIVITIVLTAVATKYLGGGKP